MALFLVLVSGQMILMSAQARHPQSGQSVLRTWSLTVAAPFFESVNRALTGLTRLWKSYIALRDVERENRALRQEMDLLRMQLMRLTEEAREAERLRALVGLQQQVPGQSLIARVIGRDVSAWFQSLVINRGQRDGVRPGAAVITPAGLVGRVVDVGPVSARVQLLTDDRSGVGGAVGVVGESRALGVVVGKNEALCKMRYVPGTEPVKEGDIVYTTGQDGIYPRGLLIGRVVSVRRGSAMVSHDILIEPTALRGPLEEVIVLVDSPTDVRLTPTIASRPQ
ncbi:MAG TPA: rod shape-determining protein MreC [Blastocatellia bacterium]|nr:rod shape-determining protein MreC [Blastocatellia bacterium]